jgi:hypothetical protein
LKTKPVIGLMAHLAQGAPVERVPSNAPTLTGNARAVGSPPLRGAAALRTAKFAVLLLRASAIILLLAPVWVPLMLLMR